MLLEGVCWSRGAGWWCCPLWGGSHFFLVLFIDSQHTKSHRSEVSAEADISPNPTCLKQVQSQFSISLLSVFMLPNTKGTWGGLAVVVKPSSVMRTTASCKCALVLIRVEEIGSVTPMSRMVLTLHTGEEMFLPLTFTLECAHPEDPNNPDLQQGVLLL